MTVHAERTRRLGRRRWQIVVREQRGRNYVEAVVPGKRLTEVEASAVVEAFAPA